MSIPAGTGRGVADTHPFLRLQQLNNEPHYRAGRIELSALLPGVVREAIDQVFVGVAEHVATAGAVLSQVLVAQVQVSKVIEQAADDALAVCRASQLGLIVPVGTCQHAVQPAATGIFDGVVGDVQGLAQVHRCSCNRRPPGGLRHKELVLVAVHKGHLPRGAGGRGLLHFLVEAVREAFKEED